MEIEPESATRNPRFPRGFTLVELLVVITIIGILIALLLPAVQAAREAARRAQCQNNLRQIGLALMNYHTVHGFFPPASHWNRADGANPDIENERKLSENWVIMILPFLEQQALFDAFDLTKYVTDNANKPARGTQLAVMLCPTDSHNRRPMNGSGCTGLSNAGDGWARGNYAANATFGYQCARIHCDRNGVPTCAAWRDSPAWNDSRIRGVMGANAAVSISEIRDGTSNTVMVAEIRAGVHECDCRGTWAMSGAGPSSLWAHGFVMGDARGPNAPYTAADDIWACDAIIGAVGQTELARMNMTCWPNSNNRQQAARCMHNGGVFACLADGSVQWISDFIDTDSGSGFGSPPTFSVWDRLMLSADGAPVPAGSF